MLSCVFLSPDLCVRSNNFTELFSHDYCVEIDDDLTMTKMASPHPEVETPPSRILPHLWHIVGSLLKCWKVASIIPQGHGALNRVATKMGLNDSCVVLAHGTYCKELLNRTVQRL